MESGRLESSRSAGNLLFLPLPGHIHFASLKGEGLEYCQHAKRCQEAVWVRGVMHAVGVEVAA